MAALIAAASGTARAQATVGEPNSLSMSTSYVFGTSSKIVETEGLSIDDVGIVHHVLNVSADYATPLRGLGVEVQLPFVGVKWDDSGIPHFPEPGEWDDGKHHFTVTDLRAGLRYQVLRTPVAAAISLAGSLPLHDYPNFGYTAPGRGLKALHAGVAVARTLDPWVPRLYLYGSYEFSLVEKLDATPETREFGQNRSDFNFQAGYFALDSLEVNLAFSGRKTHGGIDFVDFPTYPESVQRNHDALLREDAFHLGGGVNYLVNERLAVGALVRFFLGGANTRNTHMFGAVASYQIL